MKKEFLSKCLPAALTFVMALGMSPVTANAEDGASAAVLNIAGTEYYYIDTAQLAVGTETVTAGDSSVAIADFTGIGDTGIAYYAAVPLSGSLYGYSDDDVTPFSEIYTELGVEASEENYDAISSATNFTGHHVKDIPAFVARKTDAEGTTTLAGIYNDVEVDAEAYAEAAILTAAGRDLNEEQTAALITLNADPTADPATAAEKEVAVKAASYAYTCKYGDGEFLINLDDTKEGFNWTDYKNALYAAVISNGTNKAGAVWWIDLYGESATAGPHYNKVEIAVNKGESIGSNASLVNRYAAMYNETKKELKPGTYTVTLYAKGYKTLTAEIPVKSSYDGEVKAAFTEDKTAVGFAGIDDLQNPTATVTRTEGEGRQAKTFTYAQNVAITDGKAVLDLSVNELVDAVYKVTVDSDNYAPIVVEFNYTDEPIAVAEPAVELPGATTSLKAVNTAKGIQLTWKKVAKATGYEVYRGSKKIATIKKAATVTYTDSSIKAKNGTKYTYKIFAVGEGGKSELSKSVITYRVTAPAISSVKNTAAKTMTVKYKKNAKATGYEIRYSLKKSMAGAKTVKIAKKATVTKKIAKLQKGKTYYVQVRAYKKVSSKTYYSAWSAAKNVKIKK